VCGYQAEITETPVTSYLKLMLCKENGRVYFMFKSECVRLIDVIEKNGIPEDSATCRFEMM